MSFAQPRHFRSSTACCVDGLIFMQDGASLYTANPVKHLLKVHFGNARVISHHFPKVWQPRSPKLNPCHFWRWGYLKDVAFTAPITHLAELKSRIAQHILNVTPETLQSILQHVFS
ncbi:uncharacterized protein TNCV_3413551 [Trichonephila clavipes]|uniref:Transposase n=1 Tax=Trichonephila clavipes TaxID=2585209 RepID=A0A8X6V4A3_TRICX|nr:uncharacterized protein TNCV_3413551 [Trichonephila clavipes]